MDQAKKDFVLSGCIPLFKKLQPDTTARWGKMNAQQMLEHVAVVFVISAGKIKLDLATPAEHLPKYQEFLFSEKEFRENTKAPAAILGEEPLPLRYATIEGAKEKLAEAIALFENYFAADPEKRTMHPAFGELNYEEWVLAHYKHVRHHLKQFGML